MPQEILNEIKKIQEMEDEEQKIIQKQDAKKAEITALSNKYKNDLQNPKSLEAIKLNRATQHEIGIAKGELYLLEKELSEFEDKIPAKSIKRKLEAVYQEVESIDKEIAICFELSELEINENSSIKHFTLIDQFGNERKVVDYLSDDLKELLDKRKFKYLELKNIGFELNEKAVLFLDFPYTNNFELPYSYNDLTTEEKIESLNTALGEIMHFVYSLSNYPDKLHLKTTQKVTEDGRIVEFPISLIAKFDEYLERKKSLENKKDSTFIESSNKEITADEVLAQIDEQLDKLEPITEEEIKETNFDPTKHEETTAKDVIAQIDEQLDKLNPTTEEEIKETVFGPDEYQFGNDPLLFPKKEPKNVGEKYKEVKEAVDNKIAAEEQKQEEGMLIVSVKEAGTKFKNWVKKNKKKLAAAVAALSLGGILLASGIKTTVQEVPLMQTESLPPIPSSQAIEEAPLENSIAENHEGIIPNVELEVDSHGNIVFETPENKIQLTGKLQEGIAIHSESDLQTPTTPLYPEATYDVKMVCLVDTEGKRINLNTSSPTYEQERELLESQGATVVSLGVRAEGAIGDENELTGFISPSELVALENEETRGGMNL